MNRKMKFFAVIAVFVQIAFCKAHAFTFTPLAVPSNLRGAADNPLVLDGGVLYSVTYSGDFFSVGTNGAGFTNTYTNGLDSYSGLALSDGLLYGMNEGQYGGGAIYTIGTNNTNFAVVTNAFTGFVGPYLVSAPLVTNGMVYGATPLDGQSDYGAVFAVGTNGEGFADLHVFGVAGGDGSQPIGVVLVGSALYGTTYVGGTNNDGTIFTINTNGSGYAILHSFAGPDGAYPKGGLIAVGGTLYGTASAGGSNIASAGCVFSINTDGSGFSNLHSFNGSDGSDSMAALTVAGSTLYGTTPTGGVNGSGNIFQMNLDGSGFINLYSFTEYNPNYPSTSTNADGASPITPVIVAGGSLYGMAPSGGPTGTGTIFSLTLPVSSGGTVTVTTNGSGAVTPNINGENLTTGKKITLTAKPAAGYLFSNWSGSIITNSNPLVFNAEPGMFLQANFVTNPFIALAGSYTGNLYFTYNPFRAVLIKNLTVTTKGTYSGSLVFSNKSYPLSGTFSLDNLQATKQVAVPASQTGPFSVTMTLSVSDVTGPNLFVYLEDHEGIGECTAYPGALSGAAAHYTVAIPPDTTNNPPTGSPGGYGYLLVTTTAGTAKKPASATFTGALADGTAVSGTAPVPTTGLLSIYTPLYGGKGILHGWIPISTNNASAGYLAWDAPPTTKPAGGSRYYPSGFENMVAGSQILFAPWVDAPSSYESLTSLVLPTNTVAVTISANGAITGTGVTGKVNPKTGAWTAKAGKGSSAISASGAILVGVTDGGFGYTVKTNSQAVQLQP